MGGNSSQTTWSALTPVYSLWAPRVSPQAATVGTSAWVTTPNGFWECARSQWCASVVSLWPPAPASGPSGSARAPTMCWPPHARYWIWRRSLTQWEWSWTWTRERCLFSTRVTGVTSAPSPRTSLRRSFPFLGRDYTALPWPCAQLKSSLEQCRYCTLGLNTCMIT